MKKRIISLLLALVMLFGVLPVSALAESDEVTQNVEITGQENTKGGTPPDSQNKVIESPGEEKEDSKKKDETNEAVLFAAPEQVVTYATDVDRDGKYLIFSRANGTYVMAAKTNSQLIDTL